VPEESKYGIPPSNPKTTYGVGTEYAMALVISSFAYLSFDASPTLGSTHKGFAARVRFDGIRSIIPASNHLRPICSGIANLFANVKSGLRDSLGSRSARYMRSYGTVLLKGIGNPESLRRLRANICERRNMGVR